MAKAQGNVSVAIESLDKYLEMWDRSEKPHSLSLSLSLSYVFSKKEGKNSLCVCKNI